MENRKKYTHLWSPWRMKYLQNDKVDIGCVFCSALSQQDGPENLIVLRKKLCFVIINRYPYTSGHVMIVPFAHQGTILDLNAETRSEMMELANFSLQVLQSAYTPQGFNVGINIGSAAGAGIRDHVHMHVVPRWNGDTNFMSAVGDTRVLPESLEDTYWRIKQKWDELS